MLPTQPLIGVIIAAYNAERWLPETIAGLRDQTYRDWVCVIVDDGSTDSTAQLAASYSDDDKRISFIEQRNAGISSARNAGMNSLPTQCEYIAFLDSDDVYEPDALQVLTDALLLRPDAVGAYGLADYSDAYGKPLRPGLHSGRQRDRRNVEGWRLRSIDPSADATFETLIVAGPIWPPAVALQRLRDVVDVGAFDPSFSSQEDWDLYIRLARRGPFVAIDRRVAWYRRHDLNLTNAHATSMYQQERVRHKAFVAAANTSVQTRQVARAWRYLEARQGAVLARHIPALLAAKRWKEAATYVAGCAWCAAVLVRSGPPSASACRVSYTRPASLPSTSLLDS